jgi:hypothetical protein
MTTYADNADNTDNADNADNAVAAPLIRWNHEGAWAQLRCRQFDPFSGPGRLLWIWWKTERNGGCQSYLKKQGDSLSYIKFYIYNQKAVMHG